MKSLIYNLVGPRLLQTQETELSSKNLQGTEVLAATRYTVISPGTELAAWEGQPPLRPSKVYPRLLGYCNLAVVKAVGPRTTGVRVGELILTHQSHRSAFICDEADVLLRFADGLDEKTQKKISATYLYHLGYAALLKGEFFPGFSIAIVGMGTLGVATAALANAFGATPHLFTGRTEAANILAKQRLGEVHLKSTVENDRAFDIVVDTSNSWDDFQLSLKLARKGGTIVCLGFPGRGIPLPSFNPLDSRYFYDKQLVIRHCGHMPGGSPDIADVRFTVKRNLQYLSSLILDGRIDPTQILSSECSYDRLDHEYARLSRKESADLTSLVRW